MLASHVRGLGFDTGECKRKLFAGKFNSVHCAVLREHLAAARRLRSHSGARNRGSDGMLKRTDFN